MKVELAMRVRVEGGEVIPHFSSVPDERLPGQEGSSSRSGRRLRELLALFWLLWGRGGSARRGCGG
jgi:hypothetical protein